MKHDLDAPMQGICALTTGTEPCYLAAPSQADVGSIRVCNAAEGNHVLAELNAHKSRLVGSGPEKVSRIQYNWSGKLSHVNFMRMSFLG